MPHGPDERQTLQNTGTASENMPIGDGEVY